MKKLILSTLVLISLPVFGIDDPTEFKMGDEFVPSAKEDEVGHAHNPVMTTETEVKEKEKFNPRKSHWVSAFSFEGMKYQAIPKGQEFQGKKKSFSETDKELWGGRVGFGGELHLGGGLMTRSMVEGYYMGTLFSQVLNGGAEDENVKFAYTKRTGQVYGVDASQSLGWIFDFKTKNPVLGEWSYLTMEPFVEAGIGMARGYNRTNYSYKLSTTDEAFKVRTRDELLNARVGGGINFTSTSGFFLSLKATVNRYEIVDRKVDGFRQQNGQNRTSINESPKNDKIEPIVIYAIGGGYKF